MLASANMSDDRSNNKVCLVVIDGWGLRDEDHGNAIHHAKTPIMDELCQGNWAQLAAHGEHVGLHKGLMGNSEVGHLNIGAGRVMSQVINNLLILIDFPFRTLFALTIPSRTTLLSTTKSY